MGFSVYKEHNHIAYGHKHIVAYGTKCCIWDAT